MWRRSTAPWPRRSARRATGPSTIPPRATASPTPISKLHAAGQLRPSYLLRALREQRLSLFASALATLGGFSVGQVNRAIAADRPDMLALACATVGLDRSAFSTLLALVRELNHALPGGDANQARRVFDAFGPEQTAKARSAFLQAAMAV